jgi:hypothetical protein
MLKGLPLCVAASFDLWLHSHSFTKAGTLLCREYKSKDAAGQMDKSPYSFSHLGPSSPLVWLAKGYAVLDGPSMPIVAEGDEQPNDTYVEQLVGVLRKLPLPTIAAVSLCACQGISLDGLCQP